MPSLLPSSTPLNTDPLFAGDLDSTFGNNGVVQTLIQGIPVSIQNIAGDRNGKIIATGIVPTGNSEHGTPVLLGYNADGTLDSSFGDNGIIALNRATTPVYSENSRITVDTSGKIWLTWCGDGETADLLITCYNSNGTLNSSFGQNGSLTIDTSSTIRNWFPIHNWAIDNNGKIIVVGSSGGNAAIARYNSDGTLDTSFGNNGTVSLNIDSLGNTPPSFYTFSHFNQIVVDENNKIVVAGGAEMRNYPLESASFLVARYNSDGTLDSSFADQGIARFDCPHPSFDGYSIVSGPKGNVTDLFVDRYGRVFVAGGTSVAARLGTLPSRFYYNTWLKRYNSDGTPDTSFGSLIHSGRSGARFWVDSNDRVVLIGEKNDFWSPESPYSPELIISRYTANGSLDNSFDGDGVAHSYDYFFDATRGSNDNLIAIVDGHLVRYQANPPKEIPTASLWSVITPLQDSPVRSLSILVSEVVNDFGKDDLTLLLNGVAVQLLSSGATLTSSNSPGDHFFNYFLDNMNSITQADGTYELRVTANDARDASGNLLLNRTLATWQKGTTATPLLAIDFVNVVHGLTLDGTEDDDILDGSDHADTLRGWQDDDILSGHKGRDQLYGGQGKDLLIGGQGSDWLVGARGDDTLQGDMGSDRLTGGPGNDFLTGGADADAFIFNVVNEGVDTITDFQLGVDQLDLRSIFTQSQFGGDNWSPRLNSFEQFNRFIQSVQIGTDTEVRIDADGLGVGNTFVAIARLHNITATALNSSHFVLKN